MALHNVVESVEVRDDSKVYAIVVYYTDDGSFKQREEYVIDPPTPSMLNTLVVSRQDTILSTFVDPAALKALLVLAGTSVAIPVVTPPDPPTQEQIDAAKAKSDWLNLLNQMRQVDLLSPDNQFRVDLQKQIDSTFQPAFVS